MESAYTLPKGTYRLSSGKSSALIIHRVGKIEIHGSQIIGDGSLVDITQTNPVTLMPDISVRIAGSPSPINLLKFYMEIPKEYRVYNINNSA